MSAKSSPHNIGSEVPSAVELTYDEQRVLQLASLGGTVVRVAELLSTTPEVIEELRDGVIEKSDVTNMAAAVDKAIRERRLEVKVPEDQLINISDKHRKLLEHIAAGDSNNSIARQWDTGSRKIREISRIVFRKLGANGRTHSVRRSYELGIFTLPD